MSRTILAILIQALCCSVASGASFTSTISELTVDWGRQEFRFVGRSSVEVQEQFRQAERVARQRALTNLREAWPSFANQIVKSDDNSLVAGDQLATKAAFSYETVYTGDGAVIVKMRLPFSKVIDPSHLKKSKGAVDKQLLVEVDGEPQPTMGMTLVDPNGVALFASEESQSSSVKILAPWFFKPSRQELGGVGADNLETLRVKAAGPGTFVVDPHLWKQRKSELLPLLRSGRVVMVTR